MHLRRFIQTFHRWLGLILGAQVLLWMLSGVIMSWFHITLVKGETNSSLIFPIELEARNYAAPGGAIAQMEGASQVRLKSFLGQPVYEVTGSNEIALFSATTSVRISPISEKQAREVAINDFIGDGDVDKVERLFKAQGEYRGATPVWQVSFEDKLSTRIYVSPDTGEIKARRNAIWRLYDFFWMLHIMDYNEREDFNNPLIKAASATGLLFVLSGVLLIITRLRNGRYAEDFKRRTGKPDDKAQK